MFVSSQFALDRLNVVRDLFDSSVQLNLRAHEEKSKRESQVCS